MNPDDPIVQTIAQTLAFQLAIDDMTEDDVIPQPFIQLALDVLFDLAKTGVKLVDPNDVIENETDKDAHTVRLLLKAE